MKTAMDVEVVDIRKLVGDGKFKAVADVKFADCLLVKGFFVVQGKNGIFVSMPSKLSKDGKWQNVIEPESFLKRELEEKVLKCYDRETDGVKS